MAGLLLSVSTACTQQYTNVFQIQASTSSQSNAATAIKGVSPSYSGGVAFELYKSSQLILSPHNASSKYTQAQHTHYFKIQFKLTTSVDLDYASYSIIEG